MPSTPPVITSPRTTAPTPAGVPVIMMSPASSRTAWDRAAMCSSTVHIISPISPVWRGSPFTDSQILPSVKLGHPPEEPMQKWVQNGRTLWTYPKGGVCLWLVAERRGVSCRCPRQRPKCGSALHRARCLNRFPDGNHHFDFVVKIIGKRRIGHGAGAIHHSICRFCEKERCLTGVIAHFHHVFFIVAAHAKNAAHWETIR